MAENSLNWRQCSRFERIRLIRSGGPVSKEARQALKRFDAGIDLSPGMDSKSAQTARKARPAHCTRPTVTQALAASGGASPIP